MANAQTIIATAAHTAAPLLTCWLGEATARAPRLATTPAAAEALAATMAGPFALKILSHDISHKSDMGGVALNLAAC